MPLLYTVRYNTANGQQTTAGVQPFDIEQRHRVAAVAASLRATTVRLEYATSLKVDVGRAKSADAGAATSNGVGAGAGADTVAGGDGGGAAGSVDRACSTQPASEPAADNNNQPVAKRSKRENGDERAGSHQQGAVTCNGHQTQVAPLSYCVALPSGFEVACQYPGKSTWIVKRQLGQGGHGRVFSVKRRQDVIAAAAAAAAGGQHSASGGDVTSQHGNKDDTSRGLRGMKERMVMKVGLKSSKHMQKELAFYLNVATRERMRRWRHSRGLAHLALPKLYAYGETTFPEISPEPHITLLLPRLCSSASQLFKGGCLTSNDPLSYYLIAKMAKDIIGGLEFIHTNNYTHNDLKPSNILLQPDNTSYPPARFFLVDFGIAYPFTNNANHSTNGRSSRTEKENATTPHYGTTEYCSLDSHRGILPAPRGDLVSLMFTLLKCCVGVLPWTEIRQNKDQTFHRKAQLVGNVQDLLTQCFTLSNGSSGDSHHQQRARNGASSGRSASARQGAPIVAPHPPCLSLYADYATSLAYDEPADYDLVRSFFADANAQPRDGSTLSDTTSSGTSTSSAVIAPEPTTPASRTRSKDRMRRKRTSSPGMAMSGGGNGRQLLAQSDRHMGYMGTGGGGGAGGGTTLQRKRPSTGRGGEVSGSLSRASGYDESVKDSTRQTNPTKSYSRRH